MNIASFRTVVTAVVALSCAAGASGQTTGVSLPPGFSVTEVASGLSQTIGMAIAPDGRIFVCEKAGGLRVIKNGALLTTPVLTVAVAPPGESGSNGLLGVALHPQFQSNGYVYIHYTVPAADGAPAHNRISRFQVVGDQASPASETIILELHEESTTGHYGGDMKFGPDGKLYVLVGMHDTPASAQTLTDFRGKVLRLNADGSAPADNPFSTASTLAGRLTWALGLRNPFTFDFNGTSDQLFINDVGQVTFEEINEGAPGANFGWPDSEGPTTNAGHRGPFYYYGRDQGCALTAGTFYDVAVPKFPSEYVGRYFFADWCEGWVRSIDPDDPSNVATFATGTSFPMDFEVGPGGGLYYIEWQNDKVFRIAYGGGWSGANVGAVSASGSFTQDGTTFTVRGSGADIWGTADEFFFTSMSVTGDFDFSARVASVQNIDAWTKAGLMVRATLGAGSAHASVFATPSSVKGVAFQRRLSAGEPSTHTGGPAVGPPVWLRLARQGSSVTAYARASATAPWTTIGTQMMSLPATVMVGLAVSSHADGQLATAVFDGVVLATGTSTNVPPTATLTAPADGSTFTAPALVSMTASAADADEGVSRVEFQVESGGSWSTVAEDASAPFAGQAQLEAPGTYRLRVRAIDTNGAEGLSAPVTVSVTPGTTGWLSADIGTVGAAGHSTIGETTASVTGSGSDIWGAADAFHFANQPVSGDFDITARVSSVQNVNAWTKAGVMIREGLSAGARHASLLATPSTVKGVAFQRRPSAGGTSVHTSGPAQAPPGWLKLTRRGDRVRAYYRKAITDPWGLIGEQVLPGLAAVVDVGLAVSSHVAGVTATATFADLRITPLPLWEAATVGAATGSTSHDATLFSLAGSGADIWGSADAFQGLFTRMEGDGQVTARVKSIQQTHEWAKGGVMIRESLAAGSRHAFALVSAARGVALQYRGATGGTSTSTTPVAGSAPAWVRLVRAGNTITALTSPNGVQWSTLGTATIAMGANVYVGLAVTSHAPGVTATGLFDDVAVEP